jgi:nicotinate-nucleotide adenylyltransferase
VQRLGLFGGAFNPVHLGHLLVANAALEELQLDKVFFIPAARSPFKQNNDTAPAELRLRWLRLALAGRTDCEIDEQEIRRGGVSWSIETARQYTSRFPQATLFWLIGADNVPGLNGWREADELAKLVEFAAVPRPGQPPPQFLKPFRGRVLKGFPLEVSSQEIRARVKAHLPVEHLLPPFVAAAIHDASAYR